MSVSSSRSRSLSQQAAAQAELPSISDVVAESAAAAPEVAAESPAADGPKVFSVNIPNCLLKERFFVAESAEEAYGKYLALGGITSHEKPYEAKQIAITNPAYAVAVEAHNAALAKAAK